MVTPSANVVQADNLTKIFRDFWHRPKVSAVQGISFEIRRGEVLPVGFGGAQGSFVAYEVKPDGTMEGVWGGAGATQTGTETARKK